MLMPLRFWKRRVIVKSRPTNLCCVLAVKKKKKQRDRARERGKASFFLLWHLSPRDTPRSKRGEGGGHEIPRDVVTSPANASLTRRGSFFCLSVACCRLSPPLPIRTTRRKARQETLANDASSGAGGDKHREAPAEEEVRELESRVIELEEQVRRPVVSIFFCTRHSWCLAQAVCTTSRFVFFVSLARFASVGEGGLGGGGGGGVNAGFG